MIGRGLDRAFVFTQPLVIRGWSSSTTLNSEPWISKLPLSSMKPSARNLFMKNSRVTAWYRSFPPASG